METSTYLSLAFIVKLPLIFASKALWFSPMIAQCLDRETGNESRKPRPLIG